MWFKELTGFHEGSADLVRKNLLVEGGKLRSLVNGKSWDIGTFSTPNLEELRALVDDDGSGAGHTKVAELVGDAGQLHAKAENAGAVFQVASQFNLLEMTSPELTPEEGVGIYQFDPTQGPSYAIACGAGTIFRNYFVQVDGALGQTHDRQIDCLADLGCALGNREGKLWQMRNGYALASSDGLDEIKKRLSQCSASERDALRALLRVGVQKQTQVTTAPSGHKVTQVFCSALPVGYSKEPKERWEAFARVILEAAYEATLSVAVLNKKETGNPRVVLTLLGGGVFGNDRKWIFDALARSLEIFQDSGLEVLLNSYGSSQEDVRDFVGNW